MTHCKRNVQRMSTPNKTIGCAYQSPEETVTVKHCLFAGFGRVVSKNLLLFQFSDYGVGKQEEVKVSHPKYDVVSDIIFMVKCKAFHFGAD